MLPSDTQRAARAVQRDALRRLGPEARVELAFEMSNDARALSVAGMHERHPRLTEAEANRRLLRRLLGDDLFTAAYGHPRA